MMVSGIVEFLGIQPILAAEILDAGFRADPGAAEENDPATFLPIV